MGTESCGRFWLSAEFLIFRRNIFGYVGKGGKGCQLYPLRPIHAMVKSFKDEGYSLFRCRHERLSAARTLHVLRIHAALVFPVGCWQMVFDKLGGMSTHAAQSKELLVSTLSTAKNRLQYLTVNDWMLIIDRAEKLKFKKGKVLIEQGKQLDLVYILASGKVNVTASGGFLAQVGPGQVCGEMAFLESGLASATATAEEDVEAYALQWKQLIDLFELFPHLASRFYRSVAINLSRRLREQIARKQSGA